MKRIKVFIIRWPFIISLLVLWLSCGYIFHLSIRQTTGQFVYTLDDAYIHMAMAKNIAQHGVYGVTPYEFSSSSSSIVWTLLLAGGYWLFGIQEMLPLILNILLASFVLVTAYYMLYREITNNIILLLVLQALIFLTPLPAMIFCGMEHVLHILLVLWFVWFALQVIKIQGQIETKSWQIVVLLYAVTVFLVLTRFESYAMVSAAAVLLLFRKQWRIAVCLIIVAALPLFIYQYISLTHGWSWLPNSILIRSNVPEVFNSQQAVEVGSGSFFQRTGFFANYFKNIVIGSHLYILALIGSIVGIVMVVRMRTIWNKSTLFLILFVVSAFAHLQFGKIGHFFRYEAYLITWGILALAVACAELLRSFNETNATMRKRWVLFAIGIDMVIIFLMPLFPRGVSAWNKLPMASRNIYEQQYNMGMFLQHYYPNAVVAANDIGAITFLTDIKVLDLVGLASVEVLNLKMQHQYSQEHIGVLSHNVGTQIAIVYDSWLRMSGLNADSLGWKKIGEWIIQNNVVCGSDAVSFYAAQPNEESLLKKHLQEYSSMLPKTVLQHDNYLQPQNGPN